ncbi:MAG: ComEC/Rec2 family competence protein [Rikenellaceae bacterium]
MLRLTALTSVGIILAWHLSFSPTTLFICLSLCAVISMISPSQTSIALTIIFIGSLLSSSQAKESNPPLHNLAAERLERLNLGEQSESIARRITIGSDLPLDRDRRQDYTQSGLAHLLSISGLHVGIVLLIISALLRAIVLLRHGFIIYNLTILATLWLFALSTSLNPSIVRAVTMASIFIISRLLSLPSNSINTLFATALIMTIFDAHIIFDVGFQLSFIAVFALFVWALPLCSLCFGLIAPLRYLLCNIIISTICTLALAPMMCYYFGQISLLGILLTPITLPISCVIIASSLLWIALPIAPLAAPLTNIIHRSVELQNSLASWGSSRGWGIVGAEPNLPITLTIYTLFSILSIYILHKRYKSK